MLARVATSGRLANSRWMSSAVYDTMKYRIEEGYKEAFFVVDVAVLRNRYSVWKKVLPKVAPYYAVKCNPDRVLLRTLADLGVGFDCASQREMQEVLKLNISPEKIIYANPCKDVLQMEWSKQQKVNWMTFDALDELEKIQQVHPSANAVLRILVDDSHAQCQLGAKFGAPMEDVPSLFKRAKSLGINVAGVSFHVGSGCYDFDSYSNAVERAKEAMSMGKSQGFACNLLDIGGGFPGQKDTQCFEDIAVRLNQAIEKQFRCWNKDELKIIAEPGRYFASDTHTLATRIIGKKLRDQKMHYFINDGIYGSFNCIMFDHATVKPCAFGQQTKSDATTFASSIWGHTCDGLDRVVKSCELPNLKVGDWVYFEEMGAYTSAAGSHFNGFQPPEKTYIDSNVLEMHALNKAECI